MTTASKTDLDKTQKKSPAAFKKALSVLPENWVMCRDVRHSWETLNDFYVLTDHDAPGQYIARTLQCARCGTLRDETYKNNRGVGLVKATQDYRYPEGYQMTGLERPANRTALLQAEQYRRSVARAANAAPGEKDAPEA